MIKLFPYFFLFLSLITLITFISPPSAFAQKKWEDQNALCVGAGTNNDVATIKGIECLFYNALQVIVYIAGLAFLVMFISGGFQYLFSNGDEKKVAAASSTLTMAIVGLVGIIASWFILSFISGFTGIPNITNFVIPDKNLLP
jgi:hypothetical protein